MNRARNRKRKEKEATKIVQQALSALAVFEKTGNRLQFRATLDQIETFNNKK